jgi:hypothetical protein
MPPASRFALKMEAIEQNFFTLSSHNPEILIIWHLKRVVPRLEFLLFEKKASSMKEADLRNMLK